MDELWVHLQKFDSGPEKWQRLSQFWSSEKQPAIEIQNKKKQNEWIENTVTKMRQTKCKIAACGIYVVNDDNINWKCDTVASEL